MKSKITIIVSLLFFGVMAIGFSSSPAYSFWYGEKSADGDPVVLGTEYDLPAEPTCEELDDARGDIQRELRRFTNEEPDDGGISRAVKGKYWKGIQLLSCVGGCSHPDGPMVQDVDRSGNPVYDDDGNPVMVPKRYNALLISTEGDLINGWDDINAIPAKLLPNGDIIGGEGPGFGGPFLVQQDWCGNEVWSWEVYRGTWHHDHNRKNSWSGTWAPFSLPKIEGDTLVLSNHVPEDEYDYPEGWLSEGHPARDTSWIYPNGLIDDAIFIIDKEGRLKWHWFASDHIDEMEFSEDALDGIFDVNVGRSPRSDWTHFNNVNWLGPNKWYRKWKGKYKGKRRDPRFHPNNLIFDSRTNGMIGIIDHKTGEIVWKIGPMFGPDTPFGKANPGIGPIIGPHNAHMIPMWLPGAGNVIVFDNGGNSNYGTLSYKGTDCGGDYPVALRDTSRILEINPKTYKVVWMYEHKGREVDKDGFVTRHFLSTFISGVQRTIKGTTIITEGNQARIFEVDRKGRIVWEYNAAAEPGGPGVIGRALYRSYRYPHWWWWWLKDIKCAPPGDGEEEEEDV